MTKSTTVISRKRGPAATGKGIPILVRLQPDILAGLDQCASEHEITRPEAVRLIIKDWMGRHLVIKGE